MATPRRTARRRPVGRVTVSIDRGAASHDDHLSEYGIGPDRRMEILQARRVWLGTDFDRIQRTVVQLAEEQIQYQLDLTLPRWAPVLANSWLEQAQPFTPLPPDLPRPDRPIEEKVIAPWADVPLEQRSRAESDRRYWSAVSPAYAARCLVRFLDEAEDYSQGLGYGSTDELIRETLGVSPAWLRLARAALQDWGADH